MSERVVLTDLPIVHFSGVFRPFRLLRPVYLVSVLMRRYLLS